MYLAAASRRCTPEISLRSYPVGAAASSAHFHRPPARHAPSELIRATQIARTELAARNRSVRFQALVSACPAGRRPPNTSAMPDGARHLAPMTIDLFPLRPCCVFAEL